MRKLLTKQVMIIKNSIEGDTTMSVRNDDILYTTEILELPKKGMKELLKTRGIYRYFKRFMDVVLATMGLIILSPVFLIISIMVKFDSSGKVFFKHKRIGKNGKEIYIYKFRTMVENAEDLIKQFTPEQMKEFKENFKLENDPRITKVGKFLRKTSLDELPQLLNIIKGDLSIIGPRPVIEEELKKYGNNQERFLSVTPGLTGYWAANGRSCTSYEQRMLMELYYVDNISFILDVKIFFKTIISVIKREGAI